MNLSEIIRKIDNALFFKCRYCGKRFIFRSHRDLHEILTHRGGKR